MSEEETRILFLNQMRFSNEACLILLVQKKKIKRKKKKKRGQKGRDKGVKKEGKKERKEERNNRRKE